MKRFILLREGIEQKKQSAGTEKCFGLPWLGKYEVGNGSFGRKAHPYEGEVN